MYLYSAKSMTRNPTLNADTFTSLRPAAGAQPMTVQGTVNKTALLFAILVTTGTLCWRSGEASGGFLLIGLIIGTIFAFITCFKQTWAPVTAPIYAACEGLVLGGLSLTFNRAYPGIVLQAVMLTGATLAAMLGAYTMGYLRATESFKRGVFAATAGIALFYFVSMILSFFHVGNPLMYGNSWLSIGISLVVVVVAALNLVVDFDTIEQGAAAGAPKYMEWYSAFGLMVTLVWLYLEILRLLAKLNSRRD
jgi:uncharacterized YccA/Bax inhibitor family protein